MKQIDKYKSDPRYLAYLDDKEKYGDFQEGDYKDIHWYAYRNPDVGLNTWCGSVSVKLLSEDEYYILDSHSHGPITGGYEKNPDSLGFDTNHHNDFIPKSDQYLTQLADSLNSPNSSSSSNSTRKMAALERFVTQICTIPPKSTEYRDFVYVRNILYRMIDALVKLRSTVEKQ